MGGTAVFKKRGGVTSDGASNMPVVGHGLDTRVFQSPEHCLGRGEAHLPLHMHEPRVILEGLDGGAEAEAWKFLDDGGDEVGVLFGEAQSGPRSRNFACREIGE